MRVELLLLMSGHAALSCRAHAVALLGLGQDHGRLAAMIRCRVISGIDFYRIVTTTPQPVDVLVGQMRRQLRKLRVLVKKMFAVKPAVGRRQCLELAVNGLVKRAQQQHLRIAREQRVPIGSPQKLDHVPTGAGKKPLELLNDRTVASHRAIESLQVAIDDEDQVVEPFARGNRKSRQRFGFVHFAVTNERPYLAFVRIEQRAVLQITQEARVIDREQRADSHRARRELPEGWHQPWVRI